MNTDLNSISTQKYIIDPAMATKLQCRLFVVALILASQVKIKLIPFKLKIMTLSTQNGKIFVARGGRGHSSSDSSEEKSSQTASCRREDVEV